MADGILGLLGAGIDKVQGLLSNPTVQGIGLAAATGFNPLLGLIAAPGIQSSRDRKASENELLRQEILARRRQNEAQRGLSSLIADDTAVSAPIGLMNVGGGVDVIDAQRRVPTISTPQGQREALGLLAQIAPAQVSQGLIGQIFPEQGRAETSLVRNLKAAGIDPHSKQGREIIVSNLMGGSTQEQIDLLNAQLAMLNLQSKANEIEAGEQEESTFRQNLFSSTQTLLDLVEANKALRGTPQQTGPGAGLRRGVAQGVGVVADVLGFDEFSSDTFTQANILEAFDTNASQVVLDAQALEDAGVSSNLGLTTRLKSKPSSSKGFVANMVAIANNLQGRINLFDALGITDQQLAAEGLPTRSQLQAIVERARQLSVGGEDMSNDDIRSGLGLTE